MSHRSRRAPAAAAAAVLLATACADGAPVTPLAPATPAAPSYGISKGAPSPDAGRYLVGADGSLPDDVLAASGGRVVDVLPAFGVYVVDGVTNPSALRTGTRYVEAEFEVRVEARAEATPAEGEPPEGEPLGAAAAGSGRTGASWYASGVQWDLAAMHADVAWALGATGAGATVCIVDTGVDDQHQELDRGKVAARANFVTTAGQTDPARVQDGNGHGSHVAGEAAGRGVVTAGVAPGALVLGARVVDDAGRGSETAVVRGVQWCADQGAQVINVSLGSVVYRGQAAFASAPATYADAVAYAASRGVVVVVAAGNGNVQLPNPDQLSLPAQVPGTLIVGATGPVSRSTAPAIPAWDPTDPAQTWQGVDGRAFYSNWGTAIDVFAPGGRGSIPWSYEYYRFEQVAQGLTRDNVYGVCASTTTQSGPMDLDGAPGASAGCAGQTNRYVAYAGTSMAAPHVAGLAALLYAELGGARSPANRERVVQCIRSTTDAIGPSTTFGGGRVNAGRAVAALRAGQC